MFERGFCVVPDAAYADPVSVRALSHGRYCGEVDDLGAPFCILRPNPK